MITIISGPRLLTWNWTNYFWKFDEVCIFRKKRRPFDQYESIATRYINRFAIEEDDQFEIHVFHYKNEMRMDEEEIIESMEEFINKAKKGSYDINLRYV